MRGDPSPACDSGAALDLGTAFSSVLFRIIGKPGPNTVALKGIWAILRSDTKSTEDPRWPAHKPYCPEGRACPTNLSVGVIARVFPVRSITGERAVQSASTGVPSRSDGVFRDRAGTVPLRREKYCAVWRTVCAGRARKRDCGWQASRRSPGLVRDWEQSRSSACGRGGCGRWPQPMPRGLGSGGCG